MVWEYKVVAAYVTRDPSLGRIEEMETLERDWGFEGEDGWQLVSVVGNADADAPELLNLFAFFKRPAESE